MANVSQFVFFDQSSTGQMSNSFGNVSMGSALTLQIDTFGAEIPDLSLEVLGATDMNQAEDYFPIRTINLETFKTTKTITKPGIYMVIISGMGLIKIKSNGPVGAFKAYAVSIS